MIERRRSTSAIAVILAHAVASAAGAVDGVLEINQTCAVNTGCFPGDTPGFPVTVTVSGSYRLTSNLTLPTDDEAITDLSGASDVTLDLNGFTLTGIGLGAKNGIQLGTGDNWEIRNGTLQNFGGSGIQDSGGIGRGHRAIGIRAEGNGSWGILLTNSRSNTIRDCYAEINGDGGLAVGDSGKIVASTAEGNLGTGISAGADAIVEGNVANSNTAVVADGISAGSGSRITGNVASANSSAGIDTGTDSLVLHNTIRDNGGIGLSFNDSTSGYGQNVINGNLVTVQLGTQIGTNVCNGNTTCP
jgi:hypothetical protein